MSRRRFLAVTGAAVVTASAAAAVGCRDKKHSAPGAKAVGSPQPALASVSSRGGILRTYNFDAMAHDSLDPHLTQMGPVANMHSAVFSRVLRYEDEHAGTIVPDLAESMPEQPE